MNHCSCKYIKGDRTNISVISGQIFVVSYFRIIYLYRDTFDGYFIDSLDEIRNLDTVETPLEYIKANKSLSYKEFCEFCKKLLDLIMSDEVPNQSKDCTESDTLSYVAVSSLHTASDTLYNSKTANGKSFRIYLRRLCKFC